MLRIYWTDNSQGHIESANYAGRYRRPISSHKGNRIYDVTVFQVSLYDINSVHYDDLPSHRTT